jgi:hypothetical protein
VRREFFDIAKGGNAPIATEALVLASRRTYMPKKRHKPEEIVAKLRQVDVLARREQRFADAIRQIGVYICVGGQGLPAGADGRSCRMHAGADRRLI